MHDKRQGKLQQWKFLFQIWPSLLFGTDDCFTLISDVESSVTLLLCGNEKTNKISVNSSLLLSLKMGFLHWKLYIANTSALHKTYD